MKKSRVTERTRKNLVNAFFKLYKNGDVNKITVGEICKTAEYETTTFYRYFSDTNEIINYLEDSIIEDIRASIKANLKSKALANFKKFVDNYGEYITVFNEKGNRSFYDKLKKLVKEDVYDYLKFNIKDEKQKEFVFEFIFSSLLNSFTYWYRHKNMMSIDKFVEFANNMLMNGTSSIVNY